MTIFSKIIFRLRQDVDGYPPIGFESLWGISKEKDVYEIDNSPYYIYGASKGDEVSVHYEGDELFAREVISRGGHSTIRVFAENEHKRIRISVKLKSFGASCYLSDGLSLFSVDIPPEANFQEIDTFLESECDDKGVAYEDACLQHKGIDHLRMMQCEELSTIQLRRH